MSFVTILAGDEPALEPPASYYQRLLAEDQDEATEIVEKFLETQPAEQLYDGLLIPALVLAKCDVARRRLSGDGLDFVARTTVEIVEDVAPAADALPVGPRVRVLGCPARAVICLSSLPPGGLAQARYFCKRLRARYPDVKILVGRWGEEESDAVHWDVLRSAGADHVVATLLETRDQLEEVAALRPASPAVAA